MESGHDESIPCKCAAPVHFCKSKCRVPICNNTCKMPYDGKDHEHICIQTSCPYKCQVKCWDSNMNMITECGRACSVDDHAHHLDDDNKTSKDEIHICGGEHCM